MLDKAAKSSHSAALGRQPQRPLVSAPHAGAARAMQPLFASPVLWTLVLAVACAAYAVRSPADVAKANAVEAREEQSPDRLLQRGRAFASIRDHTRAEQHLSAALAAGAPAGVVLPLLLRVFIEENRYRVALLYAELHLKTRVAPRGKGAAPTAATDEAAAGARGNERARAANPPDESPLPTADEPGEARSAPSSTAETQGRAGAADRGTDGHHSGVSGAAPSGEEPLAFQSSRRTRRRCSIMCCVIRCLPSARSTSVHT